MELIKNNRFRTGSVVDIYHTPVYEDYTIAITDISVGNLYKVIATFKQAMTGLQFAVGDLCAFGFGVGVITIISGADITVSFPKSMFPSSDVEKYVGSEIQHTLFFLTSGRVESSFTVANYKEVVNQATYGYAKVVYNLQTEAEILLTPLRMVDDGVLSKILYSQGFVLKSCNDEDYIPTTAWNQTFPLELSGTSIDPVYRRAYLQKRAMESKGRRARATLAFTLIG
jgi:hypothetical protein